MFSTTNSPTENIAPNKIGPVYLRDIARALEKKLYAQQDTSLHWVAVVGEDSVQPKPEKTWHFNDSMVVISVGQGHSEGTLVYVHAQKDRYKPDQLIALFRIKLLCSPKAAFAEARVVFEFFDSQEFEEMTCQR